MTSADRLPARNRGAFYCPRCGVFAKQSWHILQREYSDDYGNEYTNEAEDSKKITYSKLPETLLAKTNHIPVVTSPPATADESSVWVMSECASCDEFSTWRGDRLMYPTGLSAAAPPAEDMPPTAKSLYREAAEVVGISPRAGTALARATLENLLRHLDPAPARNLAARIERIQSAVSTPLAQMLTIIRHTGNMALHAGDAEDDLMVLVLDPEQEPIVGLFFEAINDLVDELITRPARAQALFEKLPEDVRAKVANPKTP